MNGTWSHRLPQGCTSLPVPPCRPQAPSRQKVRISTSDPSFPDPTQSVKSWAPPNSETAGRRSKKVIIAGRFQTSLQLQDEMIAFPPELPTAPSLISKEQHSLCTAGAAGRPTVTTRSSIELTAERSDRLSSDAGIKRKRPVTAPFLISVSLHLAAAWALSHLVMDAPHPLPTPSIEIVDIVTPIPAKRLAPPPTRSEQKAATPARLSPRPLPAPASAPPVAAPRPTANSEHVNQARPAEKVVDKSVTATPPFPPATSREKGAAPPQPAANATSPRAAAPVAVGAAGRSRTASESGSADQPAIGSSYRAAYLSNPAPPYPAAARRLKLQGTATVRVMVNADGHPTSVILEKGSGAGILDEAALEAVRHWSFVPARRGDKAVAAVVDVPVRFRLN